MHARAVDAFLHGIWEPIEDACSARHMEAAESMHSFRHWQKTPRWGLFLGKYSLAFFLEKYVTWPFVELGCSVRAFASFILCNEACREAPLSRFLPSEARGAARFSYDAFRRKVSASRDWSCFEYHVFYGCEQQKRKYQIGG